MDKKIHCHIPQCSRVKSVGSLCSKHAVKKFCIKLKLGLEDIYGNLEIAKEKLKLMLPEMIKSKDLSTVLNFFQISYNVEDVNNLIKFYSKNYCGTILFNTFFQALADSVKVITEDNEII